MLSKYKNDVSLLLKPITSSIVKFGIKPNHLTIFGISSGFLSAIFIALSFKTFGIVFLILSAIFDALDGSLARNERLKTDFGEFLDSVSDRYVDSAIILSIGYLIGEMFIASIAVVGALLVSYTRAKAEKIVNRCDVGIAERGERIAILLFGLLAGMEYLALIVVAILSHITAIHRVIYTYRMCRYN